MTTEDTQTPQPNKHTHSEQIRNYKFVSRIECFIRVPVYHRYEPHTLTLLLLVAKVRDAHPSVSVLHPGMKEEETIISLYFKREKTRLCCGLFLFWVFCILSSSLLYTRVHVCFSDICSSSSSCSLTCMLGCSADQ